MDDNAAMPLNLYLKWLAMSANIQQRNKEVDKYCLKLQQILGENHFKYCILKGQGTAQLYGEQLRALRQNGDIDIWIIPNKNKGSEKHFENIMRYVKTIAPIHDFNKQHISVSIFQNVEVEIHFTPSLMFNPWYNDRLQKWFVDKSKYLFTTTEGFVTPTAEFNAIYMLQHCYNHLLFEGVGLRQIMDYYFVLKNAEFSDDKKKRICNQLKHLGLLKFSSAMMWVQQEVFHLENDKMIGIPNEREGIFFLREIMRGGNFGQYGDDDIMFQHGKGKIKFFWARMKRNARFLKHYPNEILWSPWGMLTHKYWKYKVQKNILSNL